MPETNHSHGHSHQMGHPHSHGFVVTVQHEHRHRHTGWRDAQFTLNRPYHRDHKHTQNEIDDMRDQQLKRGKYART